jgi:hypothetical protein
MLSIDRYYSSTNMTDRKIARASSSSTPTQAAPEQAGENVAQNSTPNQNFYGCVL